MEAAFKAQKSVKLPVGQDKLYEVDMVQREYYPGNSIKIIKSILGRPCF